MPISHRFRSAPTCHGQTDGCTGEIGPVKGGNFIDRQTVELCTETDHWFIQQSIVVKNRQRSDFDGQIFLCFPINAQLYAAAVASDSDDSDVVAGDASYVSSSSLLLLLSAVRLSASVVLCEHPWYVVAHCRQELHATISSVVVSRYIYTP